MSAERGRRLKVLVKKLLNPFRSRARTIFFSKRCRDSPVIESAMHICIEFCFASRESGFYPNLGGNTDLV